MELLLIIILLFIIYVIEPLPQGVRHIENTIDLEKGIEKLKKDGKWNV